MVKNIDCGWCSADMVCAKIFEINHKNATSKTKENLLDFLESLSLDTLNRSQCLPLVSLRIEGRSVTRYNVFIAVSRTSLLVPQRDFIREVSCEENENPRIKKNAP